MAKLIVGDIVKGKSEQYAVTNRDMRKAVVLAVNKFNNKEYVSVRILEHKNKKNIGSLYKYVDANDLFLVKEGTSNA